MLLADSKLQPGSSREKENQTPNSVVGDGDVPMPH